MLYFHFHRGFGGGGERDKQKTNHFLKVYSFSIRYFWFCKIK